MGMCGSSMSADEKAALAASKLIDRKNRADEVSESQKIKLLLLGAGESGKSTIFKQMRILYGDHHGFNEEERKRFKVTIYGNILTNMKTLLDYSDSMDDYLRSKLDGFMALPDGKDANIDEEIGELVKAFWADSGVQETWRRRNTFQVQDSLQFYCAAIDRIMKPDYIPTPQDILHSRVRTSGIVEEKYKIDDVDFVMFDVGGQRNERKKWIHCFDNVTAVIFVAAINEFNQVLYEDASMNRLDEAVILFDEICNSTYFKNTSMILFLNKEDLFREKLAQVPFRVEDGPEQRFVDFQGPYVDFDGPSSKIGSPEYEKCYDAAKKYILQLFLNRNRNPSKDIYTKVTCATDTKNIEHVFTACKNIILDANLRNSGFVP